MKRLLLAATMAMLSASSALGKLTFIEDNFSKAVAQAKASKRPIFVEAWAPW
jgi:hypothetical protein